MIKNLTTGKIITKGAKIATSFKDKSFGMLLKRNSAGLVFKTRWGLHTFLMNRALDIIVVDKDKQVVKIARNFPPNRIFLWNPKFDTVIEISGGTLEESKTKVGDKLDF